MLATVTVDTLIDEADGSIDDGDVSLRDAIALANAGDTIDFVVASDGGTILLTMGELAVTRSITIDATALTAGLTIDASGNDSTPDEDNADGSRVFRIDDRDDDTDSPVTVRGLSLTGADARVNDGTILSQETLAVANCTISGNARVGIVANGEVTVTSSTISGNSGPGILGLLGQVTVTNSTISGNSGGGIGTYGGVTVTDSTISGNSGSGISTAAANGDVTVTNSTVSGNLRRGVYTYFGEVTVTDSTISGNSGGGILALGVTVTNSTISSNTAMSDTTFAVGGGILARRVTVTNSTITGNSAGNAGGGIYNGHDGGSITIENSVVAGNTAPGTPDIGSGTLSQDDVRFSLIGDNTGTSLGEAPFGSPDKNGNLIGDPTGMGIIDPMLAPLADNGGPTPTHRLLPESPAIDAGDPDFDVPREYDQRGAPFSRVWDGRIDMGAYELHDVTVDILVDENDGDWTVGDLSLREAIEVSSLTDEIDVITFATSLDGGTIWLVHGDVIITKSLTIDAGSLPSGLTIDASENDPTPDKNNGDGSLVLNIDDGDSDKDSPTTIRGLTLTGSDLWNLGGAIVSREGLTISNSTISGNSDGIRSNSKVTVNNSTITGNSGFGITSNRSHVTVNNSTVSGNSRNGIGTYGGVTVNNSTITGNSAYGIYAFQSVTVTDSTISGNSRRGIRTYGFVTATNSTISGNSGGGIGAGGILSPGQVTVTNSTISGNTAMSDVGLIGARGGGIFARGVTVTNSTISGNSAGDAGGGIYINDFGGPAIIENSVVAGNTAIATPDINLTHDVRFSLIGDNTGTDLAEAQTPDENGNLIGDPNGQGVIDPLLGPLADNGGPTKTHALLPGSPAMNAGDPEFVTPPDHDQRGAPFARVWDGRIDMGAYELHALTVDTLFDKSDRDFSAGNISLREAIENTNTADEMDTIHFSPSLDGGAIVLTQGELAITNVLRIDASNLVRLTIDASGNDPTPDEDNGDGSRIFNIDDGDDEHDSEVTFNGVTLNGGDVKGDGGAIRAEETINVVNSTISGNSASGSGGGTFGLGVSVTNSTISDNSALGEGGGVRGTNVSVANSMLSDNSAGMGGGLYGKEHVTVTSSTVSNNAAAFSGGGISGDNISVTSSVVTGNKAFVFAEITAGGGIQGDTVTVADSTVSRNYASYGGGISAREVTVTSSTVSLNSDQLGGGGINGARVNVTTSDISGNSGSGIDGAIINVFASSITENGSGISAYDFFGTDVVAVGVTSSTISGNSGYYGVGIRVSGNRQNEMAARLVVASSTITGNQATERGGGISAGFTDIDVVSSIVAGNTDNGQNFDLSLHDGGELTVTYSLIGDNTGSGLFEAPNGMPDASGNLIGDPRGQGVIDPLLSPLGNFGGRTPVHALLPGSPAIDVGDPNVDQPPDHDQRGAPFDRVSGHRIDMGAFEYQIAPVNFTDDERLDCADVDAVVTAIVEGNNTPEFDFTDDSLFDHADLDVWLNLAGLHNLPSHAAYLSGDTNLDGKVDSSDLNTIGVNWRQEATGWCSGDFTADGVVDADDLNVLALNWQMDVSSEAAVANVRSPRAPLARHVAVLGSFVDEGPNNDMSSVSAGDLNEHVAAQHGAKPETLLRRRLRDTSHARRWQALQHEPSDHHPQRVLDEIMAHW